MFCMRKCWFFGVVLLTITITLNEAEESKINLTKESNNSLSVFQSTTNLNVLTQKSTNSTAGEVDDLLHGGRFKNLTHHSNNTEPILISYSEDNNISSNGKWDVELIEDGSNTEDDRIKDFVHAFHTLQSSSDDYQLITILVGFVFVIGMLGFAAYFSWRKLHFHCRKREVLINEFDPDDMRHFSI